MRFRKPFEDTLHIFEKYKDSAWGDEETKKYGFIPDYTHIFALITTTRQTQIYPKAAYFAINSKPIDKSNIVFGKERIEVAQYEYSPELLFILEKTLGVVYGSEFYYYQLDDGRLFIQNYRGELGVICPILPLKSDGERT